MLGGKENRRQTFESISQPDSQNPVIGRGRGPVGTDQPSAFNVEAARVSMSSGIAMSTRCYAAVCEQIERIWWNPACFTFANNVVASNTRELEVGAIIYPDVC